MSSASDRGEDVEATDYAADDSPDVIHKIVRARRQSRDDPHDKIALYAETICTYQFASRSRVLHDGALNQSCAAERASLCATFCAGAHKKYMIFDLEWIHSASR
jgi:hypothetical protein